VVYVVFHPTTECGLAEIFTSFNGFILISYSTYFFPPVQPEGGVEEGQIFLTPLPDNYVGARLAAPTGRWKDGLCDFFGTKNSPAGVCHPSLWCSLCCAPIAMAQVISRMQLTWCGQPGSFYSTSRSFMVIIMLVAAFFVYSTALELAALPYTMETTPLYMTILRLAGNLIFSVWSLYALCRTRQNVRARYQIPEKHCKGCEDFCCAFWCGCCVTAQMMRHTGEYENYPAVCCSKTGHPPGTPLVV